MDTRSRLHNALARTLVPELARLRLRPVLDPAGQPMVIEGDHAAVARMMRSDGTPLALRIPLSPEDGAHWPTHYAAIAEIVRRQSTDWLPATIDVLEHGITVGTRNFPAIVMEWIEGPTLLYASDRASMSGNAIVLRALADALRQFAEGMRQLHVVHGNLAPDNLMVRTNGDLVAIDLDTCSSSSVAPVGNAVPSAAYRFPGRVATGAQQDAFAMLVQYVSLLALADVPDLRQSLGDPPGTPGGALLFSSWDLADPARSASFREIRGQVRGETRHVLDKLRDACTGEAYRIPEILVSVFNATAVSEHATDTWTAQPEPSTQATATWDLSRVIDRMKATETTVPEAPVEFPQSVRKPAPILPVAADEVMEDRARLREAIEQGEDANVLRYAVRLADDPVAQLYKIDVERVLAVGYQRRIADATRQHQDDVVLQLAGEAEARNLPMSQVSRRQIRTARERIDVRGRLQDALANNDRSSLADLAVSGELVVLGDTDRASLQRVLQALEWPNMQRALETDDDSLILEAFDEELFEAGAALPAEVRARVLLARDRVAWVEQVRRALKSRDARRLAPLFTSRPRGGVDRLRASERKRADRLIQQQAALDSLETAMRSGNDTSMLKALHEVERSGARIEDRVTWSSVRHVVERASLVEQIVDAASAKPIDDRQLAHLLPIAKTMDLMHDPAFHDDLAWDRLQEMVLRGAAVRRIRRALETSDDAVIRQAAFPDVSGAIEMLSSDEQARVERARKRWDP